MQKSLISHSVTLLVGVVLGVYLTTLGLALLWSVGVMVAVVLLGLAAGTGISRWRQRNDTTGPS